MQQFDLDIVNKPAAEMVVPDSFSRSAVYPEVVNFSPEEDDPFFPYVEEKPSKVRIISPENKVLETYCFFGDAKVQELDSDNLYDADTEDIVQDNVLKRKLIKSKNNRFSTSRRDDNGQFQKLHLKNSGIMDKKSQVSEES